MRIWDERQTRNLLPYLGVMREVESVLRDAEAGRITAPSRQHVPLPGGSVLLVMPAADSTLAITKLVTVHPGNPQRGLPSVQGEVHLLDAQTGVRLGILHGAALTAVRTAAVTALAAQWLAADPAGDLLIIGAGTQATSHLECFASVFGTRRAYVQSRSAGRVQQLCDHGRLLGLDMIPHDHSQGVPASVRVVIAATTSHRPVVPEDLAAGTFVAGVGAYHPEMSEIPRAVIERALRPGSILATDTRAACHEAGDLVQAGLADAAIPALADLLKSPRRATDLAVFKSVGHALWDLAAARVALDSIAILGQEETQGDRATRP